MNGRGTGDSGEHVLIVDDEMLVASFLADVVEEFGMRVVGPVGSVDSALAAAELEPPGIAIVDVSLGSQSGVVLAAKLREAYGTAIIFVSGHSDIAANPAVQALEPIAVLSKPCPPNEIEAALRAARR